MMERNRVWIELEHPGDDDVLGDRRCELANKMLARLRENTEGDRAHFWWFSAKGTYCYGDSGGYKELSDNGQWFNLEYYGRTDADKGDTK